MKKTANRIAIVSGILLILSAILLFLTHRVIPFMMDDEWYQTMLFSEEPIRNFSDIIQAQVWHYNNWGGRSVTHTILQCTLLLGPFLADCLNVLVTFLFAAALVLASGKTTKEMYLPFLVSALGMSIGLNPNWEMSMFWQAGAANYLYITILVILFAESYLREFEDAKPLPFITFWIVPLGLLAGWSNENIGPTLCLLAIFTIVIRIIQKKKCFLWMYLGALFSLLGSVLMILAPGNGVRNAQIEANEYGLLWQLYLRCYNEARGLMEYLFIPVLLVLALLAAYRFTVKEKVPMRVWILLSLALISWGAMILSPHYPDRASFGTLAFLIAAILSLSKGILEKCKKATPYLIAVSGIIWLRGMYYLFAFLGVYWGWIKE